MQIKEIKDLNNEVKHSYSKALEAIDKGNIEYSLNILLDIVIKEPLFFQARHKLHELEIEKFKKNPFKKTIFSFKNGKLIKSAQINILRKKYFEAIANAESVLLEDISNLTALNILGELGNLIDADFIKENALEIAYQLHPQNIQVVKNLAEHYRLAKRGIDELRLRQALVQIQPDNVSFKSDLKAAAAMAAMEKSNWEDQTTSFRSKLKDVSESVILEEKDRKVHDINDVSLMLSALLKEVESASDKLPYIKKIAFLYYNSENYEQALCYFKKAKQEESYFDVLIDKSIEKCEDYIYSKKRNEIVERINSSSDENLVNTLLIELSLIEKKYSETKLDFARKRIEVYPNDMELRFEYGVALFQVDTSMALEEFQLSQNHPKYKKLSLLNIGKCFLKEEQYDLAVIQFTKVIELLNEKKDDDLLEAYYYLGIAYEKISDNDKAIECFKKIYLLKSSYLDVSDRIKKIYAKK